jgi:hypothetical protein
MAAPAPLPPATRTVPIGVIVATMVALQFVVVAVALARDASLLGASN